MLQRAVVCENAGQRFCPGILHAVVVEPAHNDRHDMYEITPASALQLYKVGHHMHAPSNVSKTASGALAAVLHKISMTE